MKRFTAPTLLFFLLIPASVVAESDPGAPTWPRLIHSANSPYSGSATGLAVIGNRAYLTTSSTIAAFDVSDPTAMIYLGSSQTSGTTQRMVAAGDNAFLVGYHADLNIHDLSDPRIGLPRIGGYQREGSSSMTGVGVSGERVFVSGHGVGLKIFDVSTPSEPQQVGEADHDQGSTQDFAGEHINVVDDLIFLAGHDDDYGALTLYRDIPGSDPQFLSDFTVFDVPTTSHVPGGNSVRVEVIDRTAFVLDTGAGMLVLDVNDPTAPKLLNPPPDNDTNFYNAPISDFALAGDLLVGTNPNRFYVSDVSVPTAPRLLVEMHYTGFPPGYYSKIAVSGTTAFVAGSARMLAIDFSDPNAPQVIGSISITGRNTQAIELVGDLAYVMDDGLGVYDISTPDNPVEIAREGQVRYQSMEVSGTRAAARLANSPNLQLFDLGADGRTPTKLNQLSFQSIRHYDLAGDRLYVVQPNRGLFTYPVGPNGVVNSPTNWYDTDQTIDFFKVEGTTLFAGSNRLGFAIYDVSDASQPSLIGSLGGRKVRSFVIDGDLVYAVRPDGSDIEIITIDISNQAAPQLIGSFISPEFGHYIDTLSVGNGFLFATAYYGEPSAYIFDVSDPSDPRPVSDCLGDRRIDDLEARGTELFLAHGHIGLRIYDTSLDTPQLTIDRALGLNWNAPAGVPFPVEGSRDLRNWLPLGRFNGEQLGNAAERLPGAKAYFRARERGGNSP